YWIILTSACTIGTTVALACADDWGPENGNSNFTPEIFVDNNYSPFFYSGQFYYGIGHDETHLTRWNETNISEWSTWLNGTMTNEQVGYLLDMPGQATLDSAMAWPLPRPNLRPARLAGVIPNMKFIRFIKYLQYAKKCEAFALTPILPAWE